MKEGNMQLCMSLLYQWNSDMVDNYNQLPKEVNHDVYGYESLIKNYYY